MHTLTDRELQVFELMGRGLSISEIASRLHLGIKTIETYRENLKRGGKDVLASRLSFQKTA